MPLACASSAGAVGAGTSAVYADASGETGFAAWTVAGDTVYVAVDEWTAEERVELLIHEKELYASTLEAEPGLSTGFMPVGFVALARCGAHGCAVSQSNIWRRPRSFHRLRSAST